MLKRVLIGLLVGCILALATLAQGAPVYAGQRHQHIATILLRQGEHEAQITLSVVDLGPSRKISPKAFRRGVVIRDDNGRQVVISGDATLDRQGRTFQVFNVSQLQIGPGVRVYKVTTIFIAVVSGDYNHPDFHCSSPSWSVERCLGEWFLSLG